ncbi:Uncharacterised protein [Delftia tsuruhatensis]|uniref:hypothetical protein n=1 Tax=Delftia tsuruhatensis TaxID=180282 RepID=UPI001E7EE19C|nr:hypothetical protein [Delftia tsuruhatensis]CAB5670770.1 Uncharacterised protein [Delftia tsuruhatensis]CAC9683078.1 Uncharacterised protein [Delftia tsuruhatensis]
MSLLSAASMGRWQGMAHWLGLFALSLALAGLWRAMAQLPIGESAEVSAEQWRAIGGRLTALEQEGQATLSAQPSLAELRAGLAALESRLELLAQPQPQPSVALENALQQLRSEVEALKARPALAQPSAPAPRARARPVVTEPVPPVRLAPFRVIGSEWRAAHRTLAIAPGSGPPRAERIQVMQVGENIGAWRLEALEAQSAIFRVDGHLHRLPIPGPEGAP